jgi:AraC-like DNA-binding protein
MQHYELTTPPELRNMVSDCWFLEQNFGNDVSPFEVLPDGHTEIIFHFGSGLSRMKEGKLESLPSPFLVGLLGHTVHFYAKDKLQIIGVKCYPWAIYDLLNLPSTKGGVQQFEHPIAGLQTPLEQLLKNNQINIALNLLLTWLKDSQAGVSRKSELLKAGNAMLNANGSLSISSIAEAAHSTLRTLERKFKASSGNTLQDVSGLIRFENARDRLWSNPDTAVVGLAHELGYADQSHLNRDFKRYIGMTASAFIKLIKKRKNTFGDNFVAIVLSS